MNRKISILFFIEFKILNYYMFQTNLYENFSNLWYSTKKSMKKKIK